MLEQQVSGLLAAIKDDLLAGEKKIYEGIVLSPMINTIHESVFRNYYLPCFAGFVNPDNWMLNWIQVAGSPMAEVGVTNDQGQVIYQVPPLLATTKVILANRSGSLNDIFKRQEILKNSLGNQHNDYVFQELERKHQELDSNPLSDIAQRWEEIFTRYGVPRSEVSSSPSTSGEDDIFQF